MDLLRFPVPIRTGTHFRTLYASDRRNILAKLAATEKFRKSLYLLQIMEISHSPERLS
jgi:hypothetical protein